MKNTLALSAAAIALLIASLPVQAGYVVDVTQVGSDVVARGSGAIDLTGLSLDPRSAGDRCFDRAGINPPLATIFTGFAPFIEPPSQVYVGFTGPTSFGPTSGPGSTLPSSGSGEIVGIDGRGILSVPLGYVSDSAVSDTSTYIGQTFGSLGVTPGTYKWTWGAGANQNFTADFAVIPEPSTWALMALGFAGLGFVGWRSRRRSVAA